MAPPPGRQAAPPRHSTAVKCIATVLLALIILTGLTVLIIWLAVQPKKLRYSIEHGSIDGYNLTNDGHLNATFKFVIRANNPNRRISLYYDRIDVTVSYEDQNLAVGHFHPFYQPRRNVTHLEVEVVAEEAAVYGAVARDLRMEKKSGDVDLDLKIRAKIRLKIGVFKIHRKLKVNCGPLTVPFSSSKGFERVFCDVDIDD
ncbi:hypothetical protein BUALT_Bualt02G0035800 [Buddleja alternifolia]|uniref:Late embryogenesis abundant protein LEA-2 subgroup domain-containing protein n=1 Tax=Buddleja alternifolia TaxID=168488 RepID=A0AAV6Y553_9LAMI|nr:hypothetical protein BUALT_Bualt02G0035800 [Buddleja alternifolia]